MTDDQFAARLRRHAARAEVVAAAREWHATRIPRTSSAPVRVADRLSHAVAALEALERGTQEPLFGS